MLLRADPLNRVTTIGEPSTLERLIEAFRQPSWMADAACREHDPRLWRPERGARSAEAKAICRACLVRTDCLGYALREGIREGIWGGFSPRERRG